MARSIIKLSKQLGARYDGYTQLTRACSSLTEIKRESNVYERIRPVVAAFLAPIDWAAAYGSGVMPQATLKPPSSDKSKPLTDLLLSTPDVEAFHKVNMQQNPEHYPVYARLMGSRAVAKVSERWGAGIWYVTQVDISGTYVKYGVMSTSSLEEDLHDWTTFYLSGRLQKPVLTLLPAPFTLQAALNANTRSALSLSLLLLPSCFTEDQLWEQIARLSYSGDPRMSIPGAENPEKVRNIVQGPGARQGFRELYGGLLRQKRVRRKGKDGEWEWEGNGEAKFTQPTDMEHLCHLVSTLPKTLRLALTRHYASSTEKPLTISTWTQPLSDPKFRQVVNRELQKIIHGPALKQSVKGLFTAGPVKSFWYAWAKFGKWFKGRRS
ncbi:uncharacterized protein L203_104625 [Cryptococcus depauperatus CBS 7841]|uniref:Phosphatidate cytidylyltransferase, mitochondrial n=1 Tax=Cryptococcus depauperatus CBS 7841 TaxID=1295531 RepID=A0A1E3IP42_9TREE|nr:mitochondrial matrix protein import protein [Cryptococcus depauperatus CBS 7841]